MASFLQSTGTTQAQRDTIKTRRTLTLGHCSLFSLVFPLLPTPNLAVTALQYFVFVSTDVI
jgi:hypothetical protein